MSSILNQSKTLVIVTVALVVSFITGVIRYITGKWVPFSSSDKDCIFSYHVDNIEEATNQIRWLTGSPDLKILYCDKKHNARHKKDSTHTQLTLCLEDVQRNQFLELDKYYLNLEITEDSNGGFYIKDFGADIATFHPVWVVWLEE